MVIIPKGCNNYPHIYAHVGTWIKINEYIYN